MWQPISLDARLRSKGAKRKVQTALILLIG